MLLLESSHFKKLRRYYFLSRPFYNILLGGHKHFGFYPSHSVMSRSLQKTALPEHPKTPNKGFLISERTAQKYMLECIRNKVNASSSMKLLDAGCGQGGVACYLAKQTGAMVEGITVVPFELGSVRRRARQEGILEKVNVQLMDYSNLSFPSSSFDRVYTVETLCHAQNLEKVLKEFYRVLKPGGRLVLFEYGFASLHQFPPRLRKVFTLMARAGPAPAVFQMERASFVRLVRAVGFKNVRVEDITLNTLPSLRRLRNYMYIPYFFAKLFGLQYFFKNPTIAVEFHTIARKGLARYIVIVAEK